MTLLEPSGGHLIDAWNEAVQLFVHVGIKAPLCVGKLGKQMCHDHLVPVKVLCLCVQAILGKTVPLLMELDLFLILVSRA